ncbi:SDR family oxidoreductase [Microbacterium sp. NPDC056044]|uniref:SDR family oxidoreductase n=1 Tax=Microbacterium sp. NPDC056044 TaxID=3345690 RepID=UPI0035DC603E
MTTSLFDLRGRTALITGSTRGIGSALADGLAAAGADIVVNGTTAEGVERAVAALAERHPERRFTGRAFDITDEDAVEEAVAGIESETGGIDILVNNAAVQHRQPMTELAAADWRRVIELDLTAPFLVGRTVARGMLGRGAGKIINICSIQTDLARPTIAPYTAAKGGLRNLTRAMTAEWASGGLQINGIAPGYIRTEMTQALIDDAAFNSWVVGRTPSGRWGEVDDLVGPAVWLASDASRYVNGQVIFIDGGMSVVV